MHGVDKHNKGTQTGCYKGHNSDTNVNAKHSTTVYVQTKATDSQVTNYTWSEAGTLSIVHCPQLHGNVGSIVLHYCERNVAEKLALPTNTNAY